MRKPSRSLVNKRRKRRKEARLARLRHEVAPVIKKLNKLLTKKGVI